MFVSFEDLHALTKKSRHSAQARTLGEMYPGIKFTRRGDGSIALRQEELDRYTLTGGHSGTAKAKRNWRPDLSVLDKAG